MSSASTGEVSWGDDWIAKQLSMLSSVKSAAVVSVASFGTRVAGRGLGEAWRLQKVSHADKLGLMARQAGQASSSTVPHLARQAGRTMVDSAFSQVATRGMQAVVGEVADAYADNLHDRVRAAVRGRWGRVEREARALFEKLRGDRSVLGTIDTCTCEVLAPARQESTFTAIVQTSKPSLGIAASGVAHGGWATVVAAGANVVNLGVSGERMAMLVGYKVSALGRGGREAKERKPGTEPLAQATQDDLDSLLSAQEARLTDGLVGLVGLVEVLNGLLQSSVCGPLVLHGSQLAAQKVMASLLP